MSRPALEPSERRSARVVVRVAPWELALWEAWADGADLTLAEYVRECVGRVGESLAEDGDP